MDCTDHHWKCNALSIIKLMKMYQLSKVTTLQSVLENMTLEEMEDTLIIIFIAETDPDSVFQISSDVQKQFHQARNQEMRRKSLYTLDPYSSHYPAPWIWPHGGDLSTIRVLSRLGRTEENFRWGKSNHSEWWLRHCNSPCQGMIWRKWLSVPK